MYIQENKLEAVINRVERFFKLFSDAPINDSKEMSSYCGYCMALRHGRIGRCVAAMYIDYFNKKFGTSFPELEGFDLYDKTLDPRDLIHKLEQPLKLCAYCASKYEQVNTFEWKQISADTRKEDILIK